MLMYILTTPEDTRAWPLGLTVQGMIQYYGCDARDRARIEAYQYKSFLSGAGMPGMVRAIDTERHSILITSIRITREKGNALRIVSCLRRKGQTSRVHSYLLDRGGSGKRPDRGALYHSIT